LRSETAPVSQGRSLEARIKTLDAKLDEVIFQMYKISDEDRQVIERVVAGAVASPDFPAPPSHQDGPGLKKVVPPAVGRKRVARGS
jgi:hypothetical protein